MSWLIPINWRALADFPIIWLTIMAFITWISAPLFFGPYADLVKAEMLIYIVMWSGMHAIFGFEFKKTHTGQWSDFVVMFIITAALLLGVGLAFPSIFGMASVGETIAASVTYAIGFGVFHAFIKAYIEEDVFRGILQKVGLGTFGSAAAFGMFHLSILLTLRIPAQISVGALADIGAMNWMYAIVPVAALSGLAVVWSFIANENGLNGGTLGSTGSHWAWNLMTQGILGRIAKGSFM